MRFLRTLLSVLSLGKDPQSFLDARWVRYLLMLTPEKYKRVVALGILDLSPHYFHPGKSRIDDYGQYLAVEFRRNRESRKEILDQLLKQHLPSDARVMDYGCGPGFLAYHVAPLTKKTYGVDISRGALACAEVLNNRPNLEYVPAQRMDQIPNNDLDFVYSFAVVQHMTDDVFQHMLRATFKKLKPGGKIFLDVVVDNPELKTEREWRSDESYKGKAKMKYALNMFTRQSDQVIDKAKRAGFIDSELLQTSDLVEYHFDDICDQAILVGKKP